ncbi:DinB family protein [Roseisolibacter sp. H3M3-2]|uniref:DinB family protein n=1 Tax=Roseisolibacter sp. H3M3-2 TaxID=3031323 RepID=UPI0023DA3A24|nr:DinB family protein [Roseisolibacter sp. H3M3-2]MDF1504255.1 DinB family protein [Roseisolibacter sp. H3M3-2]
MRIADLLGPQLEQELAVTRRVLERTPDEDGEWRPHPKSFPIKHLAQLIARMPGWTAMVLQRPELDIAPIEGPTQAGYSVQPTRELLELFDRGAAEARAAVAATEDAQWLEPWTLKARGEAQQTASRYHMWQTTVLNHLVHHRAQLGVYLRLRDVPVPGMYGPTADEKK